MTLKEFSKSSQGLPIWSYNFCPENPSEKILILGGVHGDEIEGVWTSQYVLKQLLQYTQANEEIFKKSQTEWTIVPEFNPEGILQKTRGNWNGVDLNRNLPTKDWKKDFENPRYNPGPNANSESENQGLVGFLNHTKIDFILSIHSWKPMINTNGNCEPYAFFLHQKTSYRIEPDIGYPTPGCLGTYCGFERGIPTITLEIERGLPGPEVINLHGKAIWQLIKAKISGQNILSC